MIITIIIFIMIIISIITFRFIHKDKFIDYLKLIDIDSENRVKEKNTMDDYLSYLKDGNYLSINYNKVINKKEYNYLDTQLFMDYPTILHLDKDTGIILEINNHSDSDLNPNYIIKEITFDECKYILSSLIGYINKVQKEKSKLCMSRGKVQQMFKN